MWREAPRVEGLPCEGALCVCGGPRCVWKAVRLEGWGLGRR